MTTELVTTSSDGWCINVNSEQISALMQAMDELLVLLDPSRSEDSWVSALAASMNEPFERPQNPALYLVLPDLSTNEVFAAEMRALTEEELRRRKSARLIWLLERLSLFLEDGSCVNVARDEVWQWLKGLNDIRFALYASLQLVDENAVESVAPLGPIIPTIPIEDTGEDSKVSINKFAQSPQFIQPKDDTDACGRGEDERLAISNIIQSASFAGTNDMKAPSKTLNYQGKREPSVDVVSIEKLYDLLTEWQESLLSKMEADHVDE